MTNGYNMTTIECHTNGTCGPEGPTEVKRREARILVLQLYLFSET